MPVVEPSTEVAYRVDFVHLANARGYIDAVEVGVDQGVFAKAFLTHFRGNWLFLVDPYLPYPDFRYDRSGDLLVAVQALAPFHGKFRFVRARSTEAAPWVATVIRPQFVYVDGSHDEPDVAADLEAWWAVLADGGILAGHDYDEAHPGVIAAVNRFADARGLVVRLTHERTSPPSWYVYKGGEPKELISKFFRDGAEPNPRYVEPDPCPPSVA